MIYTQSVSLKKKEEISKVAENPQNHSHTFNW